MTRAAGLSALALAASAAAGPAVLREAFIGGRPPASARYQTDEGAVFVLDRTATPKTLLKFENDPEIWVLNPAHGPRGDVIYRNDLGEEMLRATGLGGLTVFTPRRPEGSAAAYEGGSPPLRIGPMSATAVFERFYEATIRASSAARRNIGFETGKDADPRTGAAYADAAQVAGKTIAEVAERPNGRLILSHVDEVVITQGGAPNVVLKRGVLTVTIVPKDNVFGRPSSRRIERAVGAP